MSYDIVQEILDLKKKKNATILAHYYEDGDIQDIADFVGDSFFLSKKGQEVQSDLILLAGVVFMAESVKILNPTKKVLVPDLNAGCSLVDSSPFEKYLAWRQQYPEGIAVTYINSSAEVKSISDVIVTSSNAEKIINSIPKDRKILFGPDQHLGRYLMKKLNRDFVLWPGACEVHILFNAKRLNEMIFENPDAIVIAHPECEETVLQYAHVIGSTSRLLEEVENNPAKKFIVATETGIFHQMQKLRPDVTLLQAPVEDKGCACNNCPYMKLNTLEKIKLALETEQPQVDLASTLRKKAEVSLDRMMAASAGKPVSWPEQFLFS
ncbi:MAG: quinolinate synthase NadA [Bdellovibrionales bacterium]|nr:quinolinate synthase NadA [Bdellovibrionales bacterium]